MEESKLVTMLVAGADLGSALPVKKEMKSRRLQRTQLQHVARLQDRLLNPLAVQECAVTAAPVKDRIGRVLRDDDRVLARDKRIQQNDVLAGGPAQ